MKFEAGTPAIVSLTAFGVALEYLMAIGMRAIRDYETKLAHHLHQELRGLNFIKIYGDHNDQAGICSFNLVGNTVHPHDISTILDQQGIAIRSGQHCAQLLMKHLGISASARVSLAFYNTTEEIDRFIEALHVCYRLLS